MDLRHVRYFLAVVDAGSVTAASAVVHVTQPSLSRQLRLFERDWGSVCSPGRRGAWSCPPRVASSCRSRVTSPGAPMRRRRLRRPWPPAVCSTSGSPRQERRSPTSWPPSWRPCARRTRCRRSRRSPTADLRSSPVGRRSGHLNGAAASRPGFRAAGRAARLGVCPTRTSMGRTGGGHRRRAGRRAAAPAHRGLQPAPGPGSQGGPGGAHLLLGA